MISYKLFQLQGLIGDSKMHAMYSTLKYVITFGVLCTALFVALDAAPVQSTHVAVSFEVAGEQQSDEIAKSLLKFVSKILTFAASGDKMDGDGRIRVTNELRGSLLNVARSLLSAVSKKADARNQIILNGLGSFISTIEKQVSEGRRHLDVENELRKTLLNIVESALLAAIRKADPNNEITQTGLLGMKTLLSGFRNLFEKGGETQIQTFDEIKRMFLNFIKIFISAVQRNTNSKDDLIQFMFDQFDTLISLILASEEGGTSNEAEQIVFNRFFSPLPEIIMKIIAKDSDPKQFVDQSILESMDENAAMVEGDVHVAPSEEAKTQPWGAILHDLATGVLNKI